MFQTRGARLSLVRDAPRAGARRSDNRSKFNVPLGIESQGFCVLPKSP